MSNYLPLKYPDMKARVVCTVERDDGYNGSTVRVGLAQYEGEVYEVADCGYYHSCHFHNRCITSNATLIRLARQCDYYRNLKIVPCPKVA